MTEVLTYEALKADRDAQQKRADALAVENASLFAAAGEVYAAGYNHGHLNTVDGIAYTESVEVTFAGRGAQVMAEFAYPPIDNKDNAQLEALIAESASLKSAITTHSQSTHFCELCGKDDPCSTDDVCYALNETPATDAAVAAIEARVWAEAKDLAKSMLASDSADCIDFLFDGKIQQLREAK